MSVIAYTAGAGKLKPKYLLLVNAIFLLFGQRVAAQPGGDGLWFSPFYACDYVTDNAENIFVGRIILLEEIPNPYQRSLGPWWKAMVSVGTILKGRVSRTVEINLPKYPFGPSLSQIKGKTYIFIANRIRNESFTGLFSTKLSWPLDEIPPNDLAKILAAIRSALRGVPQPRIMGIVQDINEYGPLHPLPGIIVVAEDKDGKQYRTVTDTRGYFQFTALPLGANPPKYHTYFPSDSKIENLPNGTYAVYPILPNKVLISSETTIIDEGRIYIQISNKLCSARVEFNVVIRQ